jgi:hypothetical protein
MLRKVILGLAVVFLMMCSVVRADEVNVPDWLSKLPGLNQAVIFSLDDNEFQYATTITLASLLKDRIKLDVGYTPKQELIGLASVKLVSIKDYITFPIIDKIEIEPFVYIGLDRMEDFKELGEYDYGLGVKILAIKF